MAKHQPKSKPEEVIVAFVSFWISQFMDTAEMLTNYIFQLVLLILVIPIPVPDLAFSEINFLDATRPIHTSDAADDDDDENDPTLHRDVNDVPSQSVWDMTKTRPTDTIDIDTSKFSRYFRQSKPAKETKRNRSVQGNDHDVSQTSSVDTSRNSAIKRKRNDTEVVEESPPLARQRRETNDSYSGQKLKHSAGQEVTEVILGLEKETNDESVKEQLGKEKASEATNRTMIQRKSSYGEKEEQTIQQARRKAAVVDPSTSESKRAGQRANQSGPAKSTSRPSTAASSLAQLDQLLDSLKNEHMDGERDCRQNGQQSLYMKPKRDSADDAFKTNASPGLRRSDQSVYDVASFISNRNIDCNFSNVSRDTPQVLSCNSFVNESRYQNDNQGLGIVARSVADDFVAGNKYGKALITQLCYAPLTTTQECSYIFIIFSEMQQSTRMEQSLMPVMVMRMVDWWT